MKFGNWLNREIFIKPQRIDEMRKALLSLADVSAEAASRVSAAAALPPAFNQ